MISDVLANGPALVAWAAVLYKLSSRRRSPDDPAAHPYLWTLVALASALTVLAHPVYFALDRLVGVPNLARLIGHGFIMLTAHTPGFGPDQLGELLRTPDTGALRLRARTGRELELGAFARRTGAR